MPDKDPWKEKIIETHNLVKAYSESQAPALNGLSISVEEGQIFGLLGPNGAGKTTAISIMTTLLKPTSGSVSVCGIDAVRFPGRIKGLIGLVPQEIALYANLTIRENLLFYGRMNGLQGRALKGNLAESLQWVGLEENADQPVYSLSGGMKRRANLVVGILHQPKILFLDEPTVGIDPQSRNWILEKLSGLKGKTTMIYTTHYLEEAESLCSTVAIMDSGRILAEGPPKELLNRHPLCSSLEDLFIALTGKKLRD